MRAIMISIKPEWVEKILNGKKTIEIRKTMPKCELPCKVYIYCTKGKNLWLHNKETIILGDTNLTSYLLNGKVVAEFTLNKIEELENVVLPTISTCVYLTKTKRFASAVEKMGCLSQNEIYNYLGGKNGYAWHITNLKIYDTPKELEQFYNYDKVYNNSFGWAFTEQEKREYLTRPPQSWCYVEEEK